MLITTNNCYVTLEEANDYFAVRLGSDYWDTLEDEQKEKALITATKRIDRLPFIGYKASPNQSLQFPRLFYRSYCCSNLEITTIPQQLKDAVCEEAITNLLYIENNSEDVYNGAISSNYQSLKLGDASITYGGSSGSSGSSSGAAQNNYGVFSDTAYELLSGLIKIGYDIDNQVYIEER